MFSSSLTTPEKQHHTPPEESLNNLSSNSREYDITTTTKKKKLTSLPDWYNSHDHIAILGSATEGSVAGAWFRDIEVMDEDLTFVNRFIHRHQTPKYFEGRLFTALMNDEIIAKGGGLRTRLGKLSWLFKMNQVLKKDQ